MPIVLRKAAHAHDAVQAARRLIPVTVAELAIAQRQIPVTLDPLLEDQDMARAVHGLQRIFAFLRLRDEHVFAVLFPVPGLLPQTLVEQLRALDFLVAIVLINAAHVLLHALPQGPTLWVPENQSRRMVVNMKQVQFAAQFAVVTLLGLFQHRQVLLQVILGRPGGAVNTLQHFIFVVTAPVGAGHLHQFEVL